MGPSLLKFVAHNADLMLGAAVAPVVLMFQADLMLRAAVVPVVLMFQAATPSVSTATQRAADAR